MKLNRLLTLCLGLVAAAPCVAQSPCDADLDHDGIVAGADLAIVLGDWGPCKGCQGDVTNNGLVDGIDLAFVLTRWNHVCQLPWATVLEHSPNPTVVLDTDLRNRIAATGLPWRVRDKGSNVELLLVPPGTFEMGCSASDTYPCISDEIAVHTVTLTYPFYMGRFEVTQGQWAALMGTNPSWYQGPAWPNAVNRPVEQVSWNTVQGFLAASGLRLPTEAEWEYACRARTTTAFHATPDSPGGTNQDSQAASIAWHYLGSCVAGDTTCQPQPVGHKHPNALGMHDMLGNLWEWVSDWYAPYDSTPLFDPVGPEVGTQRVARGGGFMNQTDYVRTSSRAASAPNLSYYTAGFRVARNP